MNANEQLLETLAHSEMCQNYERAYTDATGLPVTLRPVETWQLPPGNVLVRSACCCGLG